MVENTYWNYLQNSFTGYYTALEHNANNKELIEDRKEIFLLKANQYLSELKKLDRHNKKVHSIFKLIEELIEQVHKKPNLIPRFTEILREIGDIRGTYGKYLPEKKKFFLIELFSKKQQPTQQGLQ